MKMANDGNNMVARAAEALRAVLGEVSSVKLMEMRFETPGHGQASEILAKIDVLGHRHTMTCEVNTEGSQRLLMTGLRNSREGSVDRDANSTFVMIAPYLSPEAQAICKESHTNFIDLQGNARITIGEIFIGKRTMVPRMREPVMIDPSLAQEAKTRPQAPRVYIASNIPGSPTRVNKDSTRGIAVA